MASPTTTTIPQGLTGDSLIDAAITGYKWNLGLDRGIDWSFSDGLAGEYWGDPAGVRVVLQAAFDRIAYYANVKFNYLGYYSNPNAAAAAGSELNGFLSASTSIFPSSASWARGYFPSAANGAAAGDVVLNVNSILGTFGVDAYGPGSKPFAVVLHELMHALGLKHPHDDGGTGHPTLTEIGAGVFDIDYVSLMSYNDDYNWNLLQWNPTTPMPLDVLALQYLYGKNMTTNAGDSRFNLVVDNTYKTIWDASGLDTVNARSSNVGWRIELPEYYFSDLVDTPIGYAMPLNEASLSSPRNITWLMGDFEIVFGSNFADEIVGDSWVNTFDGGGGNDLIDGGDGLDQAGYVAASANYSWTRQADGSWKVIDLRPGSPEGTDTLRNVERLLFSDRNVDLPPATPGGGAGFVLGTAFQNILRADASWSGNAALAAQLANAGSTAAIAALVQQADTTTSVATLSYQFFTGQIPGQGGIDYLVSPTGPNPNNLNSAYYQSFNLENRYINFAVNLGKNGDGKAAFEAAYGGKTLLDTMKSAYLTIFGSTPNDAKAHALLDPRVDYFAYYGQDGTNGIGTKAALVGWLLAEAAKADIGVMQTANMLFLADLADGATFAVNLVGNYQGTPYMG